MHRVFHDIMATKYSFSLLNADRLIVNKSWNYKNVISPFYRIWYIDKGRAWLSTPEGNLWLEPDHLYLAPSFTLFNQGCNEELGQYYIHFIEESADGDSLFATNRKLFGIPAITTDLPAMKRIIELNPGRDLRPTEDPKIFEKSPIMRSSLERNKLLPIRVLLETEGLIMQLLSRFVGSDQWKLAAPKNSPQKIPGTLEYIGVHLAEKLTVEMLASRANLSVDYFSNLFRQETGERPLAFIQRKRIERAQFLLLTSGMPLSVIAIETGFEDLSYFSRSFKKLTGYTPGAYKRMNMALQ